LKPKRDDVPDSPPWWMTVTAGEFERRITDNLERKWDAQRDPGHGRPGTAYERLVHVPKHRRSQDQ